MCKSLDLHPFVASIKQLDHICVLIHEEATALIQFTNILLLSDLITVHIHAAEVGHTHVTACCSESCNN